MDEGVPSRQSLMDASGCQNGVLLLVTRCNCRLIVSVARGRCGVRSWAQSDGVRPRRQSAPVRRCSSTCCASGSNSAFFVVDMTAIALHKSLAQVGRPVRRVAVHRQQLLAQSCPLCLPVMCWHFGQERLAVPARGQQRKQIALFVRRGAADPATSK